VNTARRIQHVARASWGEQMPKASIPGYTQLRPIRTHRAHSAGARLLGRSALPPALPKKYRRRDSGTPRQPCHFPQCRQTMVRLLRTCRHLQHLFSATRFRAAPSDRFTASRADCVTQASCMDMATPPKGAYASHVPGS
jgi:hypothetical protein